MLLQKLFHRFCPRLVRRLIDPVTYGIDQFVISTVSKLESKGFLLDAGAGECRFKEKLENVQYVAVDTAWGDERWDYSNIDAVSNIDRLPFAANVFGVIICTQVLEHVQEPERVLEELFRVLQGGGTACITAPQGWGVHQPPHDYFRFTSYALSYLLQKVGFEQITITPSCGYFGYLANRLTIFPKALFWQIKLKWLRLLLFPLEFLSYVLFVGIIPLLLNALDFLDRRKDYTLNYFVTGRKTGDQRKSD